jgi:hypothetical protein
MTPWESLEAHGHVQVNAIAVVFRQILTSLSPMECAAWPMVDGVADMSPLVPWLRPMAAPTWAHDGSDSKLDQRPAMRRMISDLEAARKAIAMQVGWVWSWARR